MLSLKAMHDCEEQYSYQNNCKIVGFVVYNYFLVACQTPYVKCTFTNKAENLSLVGSVMYWSLQKATRHDYKGLYSSTDGCRRQ